MSLFDEPDLPRCERCDGTGEGMGPDSTCEGCSGRGCQEPEQDWPEEHE